MPGIGIGISPFFSTRIYDSFIPPPPYVVPFTTEVVDNITELFYTFGAGPSPGSATFKIIADGLLPISGNITITPTANIEIFNGTVWTGSAFTIPYTGGQLSTASIYQVRLKAGLAAGNYNSDTVTFTGGGATPFVLTITASSFDTDVAVINAAASPTQPFPQRQRLNQFVITCKVDGNWTIADIMYLMDQFTEQASKLNLKDPSQFALINSLTVLDIHFTPYYGMEGNGIAWLNTQWKPKTHGVNYQLNDASHGAWTELNIPRDGFSMGAVKTGAGASQSYIVPKWSDTTSFYQINSLTGGITGAGANGSELITLKTTAAGATQDLERNGILVDQVANTTTDRPDVEMFFFARNFTSNFPLENVLKFGFAGSAAFDFVKLTTALNTYFDVAPDYDVVVFGDSFPAGVGASASNKTFVNLIAANKGWNVLNRSISGSSINQNSTSHVNLDSIPTKRPGDKKICFFWSLLNDCSSANGGTQSVVDTMADYQTFIDNALAKGWSISDMVMMNGYNDIDDVTNTLVFYLTFIAGAQTLANSNGILFLDTYAYARANGANSLFVDANFPPNVHPNDAGHQVIADYAIPRIELE